MQDVYEEITKLTLHGGRVQFESFAIEEIELERLVVGISQENNNWINS